MTVIRDAGWAEGDAGLCQQSSRNGKQVSKTHPGQLRKTPSQGPVPARPPPPSPAEQHIVAVYSYFALVIPHGERAMIIEEMVGRHCLSFLIKVQTFLQESVLEPRLGDGGDSSECALRMVSVHAE